MDYMEVLVKSIDKHHGASASTTPPKASERPTGCYY